MSNNDRYLLGILLLAICICCSITNFEVTNLEKRVTILEQKVLLLEKE